MLYIKHTKNNKIISYTVFILIMAFIITGFYVLNSVYALSSKNSHTVVFPTDLFKNDASNIAQIESIIKRDIYYHIDDIGIIDNNNLIFGYTEAYTKGFISKKCVLNINDNTFSEVAIKSGGYLKVSPDGKKILYTNFNSQNGTDKTNLYDIQSKEVLKTFDGVAYRFLPDGKKYLGLDNYYMFIQDIEDDKRENIISLSEFYNKYYSSDSNIQKKPALQLEKTKSLRLHNYKSSMEGDKVYFLCYNSENQVVLYKVDIKNENFIDVLTKGNVIIDYIPLNDDNLLLCGNINGEVGVFMYSHEGKKFHQLVHGSVYSIDMATDGKVAYTLQNNGIIELHIAHFSKDRFEYDKIIYNDIKNVLYLKWINSKALFCIDSNDTFNSRYSVFRFNFKAGL